MLQRAMVDFGADESFEKASQKLKEHYGIEVPISAVRVATLGHGAEIKQIQEQEREKELPERGAETVILETDGSMLPVVRIAPRESSESPKDGRKRRKRTWEEARLSLARDVRRVTPHYAGIMGDVAEVGSQLLDCAIKAGAGKKTLLHGLGDGATWIPIQMRDKFGRDVKFTLDYYHVSEYLAAAGEVIAREQKRDWLRQQQQRLKENRYMEVMGELRGYRRMAETNPQARPSGIFTDQPCPVEKCARYLEARLDQLDYQAAIQQDLPIGTGEVEGGHRSIMQFRIKLPGASWTITSINKMLALRTHRANNNWDSYWAYRRQAAA